MRRICGLLSALVLFGCTKTPPVTDGEGIVQPGASRLDGVELTVGMAREKVEEQVATLLGKPKTYSPHGNNLRGGTVRYRDGDWVLQAVYKAGVPAPWVQTPAGSAEHLRPIDETLIEYKIERIPSQNDNE